MNGIVTRNVSTSDTDCAISTPSTPNIIGRIRYDRCQKQTLSAQGQE